MADTVASPVAATSLGWVAWSMEVWDREVMEEQAPVIRKGMGTMTMRET
ncbi:protein of unknown function [Candidatus Nitrospira inopinata]|uniref:Uncharacterized protein n=1 Tax=Candidatus Nitrospira inopinata TaxID=1715989 RepID=A0A0S4KME7_9BACT|nr:protein of unknown function [Candidatus Nitrospira inopinata]